MQLIFSFRNVAVGTALVVAGYYAYRGFVADIETNDVRLLVRAHHEARPARRVIIKHRILRVYTGSRDYKAMFRTLDSPSPVSQALAVEVLVARGQQKALPKLREMLDNPKRDGLVKEALARAMGTLKVREAIPRLIELTDAAEPHDARLAAHGALQSMTDVGAGVKFSEAARQNWTLWWRDHRNVVQ
ncbi:HEAT repeat domain-containing protein [Planctomycetota bacterium]